MQYTSAPSENLHPNFVFNLHAWGSFRHSSSVNSESSENIYYIYLYIKLKDWWEEAKIRTNERIYFVALHAPCSWGYDREYHTYPVPGMYGTYGLGHRSVGRPVGRRVFKKLAIKGNSTGLKSKGKRVRVVTYMAYLNKFSRTALRSRIKSTVPYRHAVFHIPPKPGWKMRGLPPLSRHLSL